MVTVVWSVVDSFLLLQSPRSEDVQLSLVFLCQELERGSLESMEVLQQVLPEQTSTDTGSLVPSLPISTSNFFIRISPRLLFGNRGLMVTLDTLEPLLVVAWGLLVVMEGLLVVEGKLHLAVLRMSRVQMCFFSLSVGVNV